jgi:hypothetical protein
MGAEIFGLGASILLASVPFDSALRTAEWPVGDFEEGTLRFSREELTLLPEWNLLHEVAIRLFSLDSHGGQGTSDERR